MAQDWLKLSTVFVPLQRPLLRLWFELKMPLFGLYLRAELENVEKIYVSEGVWQIEGTDMNGNVCKTLQVASDFEDAGLETVKFDRFRSASLRRVRQEQFQKHKALRKEQSSDEYLASDSGSNVLLAVFDCRNMIPVAAQIPLSIKDL